MTVSTTILCQLPIGTLFHDLHEDDSVIYEIVGYVDSKEDLFVVEDLFVIPLFHGSNMERRKLGIKELEEWRPRSWHILGREDKDRIARKMGFESSGIRIIGIKCKTI